MNKEEILAKSRAENKNGDERDTQNQGRAYSISTAVATVACLIMIFIEENVFGRSTRAIWVIYTIIEFTTMLSEAILIKKRWMVILSVVWALLLAGMLYLYIQENFTK